MPRIVVAVPRDGAALKELLQRALAHDGPFALRYPRGKIPIAQVPALDPARPSAAIGTGELLRDGDDLAILAVGPVVYQALEAAQRLAEQGLSVAVADARYVRPLDTDLVLGLARRTRRMLTVEDGVAAGGFGSAVLEALAGAGVAASAGFKVKMLGLPEEPLPHGAVACQLRACGLDAQGIYSAALDLVGR